MQNKENEKEMGMVSIEQKTNNKKAKHLSIRRKT